MTLNELIRKTAKVYPTDSPKQLAKRVVAAVPAEELDGYFLDAVASRCSTIICQTRNTNMSKVFGGRAAPTPKASKAKATTTATVKQAAPVSARLKAQQDWANMLASRVYVGKDWKSLGDCTVADLKQCIKQRTDEIASLDGRITQFNKLVKVMETRKLKTVNQIKQNPFPAAA